MTIRTALGPFAVLALLALGACGSEPDDTAGDHTATETASDPDEQELAEARATWEAAGITDYDWSYDVICFCPAFGYDLEVRDGLSTGVVGRASDRGGLPGESAPTEEPEIVTVDDLFDHVESLLADDLDAVTVTYDEETGRPTKVTTDPDEDTFDDESILDTTSFVAR